MLHGRLRVFFLACLAVGVSSCASRRTVDYEGFEVIPSGPASELLSLVARSVPPIRARAFYGNYGGPGAQGGKPVDAMDDLFRKHDITYYEATAYRTLLRSDQLLVEQLDRIPPETLTPEGLAYQKRAMRYFLSPLSMGLGKPLRLLFSCRERYPAFLTRERLRHFYEQPSPGVTGFAGSSDVPGREPEI